MSGQSGEHPPSEYACKNACGQALHEYAQRSSYRVSDEGDRALFLAECAMRCADPGQAPTPQRYSPLGFRNKTLLAFGDEKQCARAVAAAAGAYRRAMPRSAFDFDDWAESVCVGVDPMLRDPNEYKMAAARAAGFGGAAERARAAAASAGDPGAAAERTQDELGRIWGGGR